MFSFPHSQHKWEIFHVSILREYLFRDLQPSNASWMSEKDRERLIDDFVFIMILLGNDFLPELPSLDIVNGSIQDLIAIYKYSSFSPNRWLTRREVCLDRHKFLVHDAKPSISLLRQFFQKLSETEEVMIALLQQPHNARPRRGERTSSPPVRLRCGTEA